jgi:hypothetical protein
LPALTTAAQGPAPSDRSAPKGHPAASWRKGGSARDRAAQIRSIASASRLSSLARVVARLPRAIPSPQPRIAFPLPGRVIFFASRARPKLGSGLPRQKIAIPAPGHAIPRRKIAIPQSGNAFPNRGIAIPPYGLAIPPLKITIPKRDPRLPPRKIAIPKRDPRLPPRKIALSRDDLSFLGR